MCHEYVDTLEYCVCSLLTPNCFGSVPNQSLKRIDFSLDAAPYVSDLTRAQFTPGIKIRFGRSDHK